MYVCFPQPKSDPTCYTIHASLKTQSEKEKSNKKKGKPYSKPNQNEKDNEVMFHQYWRHPTWTTLPWPFAFKTKALKRPPPTHPESMPLLQRLILKPLLASWP